MIVFRFLKSVRLAVVLILLITVLSLLATLVPQGLEDRMYRGMYPPYLYALVTAVDFNRFFSSPPFLALVALLALNLAVCAADRFLRQLRKKSGRRWGPDLVHAGLLVLMAGALVTGLTRQEKDFRMAEGDQVQVTPEYALKLVSLEAALYDNGSPRSWTSIVQVLRNGVRAEVPASIRVNHPLRLHGLSVYQSSWGSEDTLVFRDDQGNEVQASDGEGFQDGESFWYFARIEKGADGPRALFQEFRGRALVSVRRLALQETVGPLTLLRMGSRQYTGLRAARDPGYAAVVAALALLAAGLALTFIQKRLDRAD